MNIERQAVTAPMNCSCTAVQFACHSIAGMRRYNEDVVAVSQNVTHRGQVLTIAVLCDGMGGRRGGRSAAELAAQTCLSETIRKAFLSSSDSLEQDVPEILLSVLQTANIAVLAAASKSPDLRDMGTTLVTCVVIGNTLYVASVGDSRCYLYREATLEQLTHDDSFVQILVDLGQLSPQEAESHPRANEITRCIGAVDALDDVSVIVQPLQPGDRVLLCSDGLWKDGETDIHTVCASLSTQPFSEGTIRQAVTELTEKALERGSDDNISAALLWLGTC